MACALGACAGRGASDPIVGVSDKAPNTASRSAKDAGAPDGAASLPASYRTAFKKVNRQRFVSRGHAFDRFEVDVYANEAGEAALASRAREVPVGAIVVEEHHERMGEKRPGPVMMMEKRAKGFAPEHGDWRFVVVGAGGQLVSDGAAEQCAGCHDDAPMDGLFPPSGLE